ncbi:MAG: hypothetical protein JNK82_15525 [Myxococcaceae bacterium]|nr:hypothetical protein [Myxococcaceae bacterium]
MRIVALMLLCSTAAAAQDRNILYINPAPLVTASRLQAMAGAAVGIAEGSESLPFNYAAVAQRHPRRKAGFDWDLNFSVLFSPFQTLRDIDNEGNEPVITAPVEYQVGGLIQFARFGIGTYVRGQQRSYCNVQPCIRSEAVQGSVIFGFNVWRDQIVFGVGLHLAIANFDVAATRFEYRGLNLGASMLVRPAYLPFRIGVHGVSETRGAPAFDPATLPDLGGRTAFAGVVSPARIFIGASARFGEGAWRYNRLSASALKELPNDYNYANVPHDLDPDDPRPPGRFLATFELDVIFPVKNATTFTPFLTGTLPRAVGEQVSLVPRLGFEAEAIDHRLRVRSGGYLEPPFLAGSSLRPHFTWGFELFLLNLGAAWSISASMDVAKSYLSMSFGIGWWT